ncbi:cytochrome P450 [Streptomyces narbonensis]
MIAYDDPEYAITEEVGAEAAMELIGYAMTMAAARKECPAADIVSQLVAAEGQGNLSSDEFGLFVLLLAVAGNETTRNAISHGMHAFLTSPRPVGTLQAGAAGDRRRGDRPLGDTRGLLPADSQTQDAEIGRAEDPRATASASSTPPPTTTPRSSPTPSASTSPATRIPTSASAAAGPRFCLGKSLAIKEIELIFNAIADVLPDLTLVGEPRRLRAAWLNGVKELRVRTSA